MTRRRNDAAREHILRTAFELFSSDGYEAVSVERVARAAKLTKAIVFYYYPSKEALGEAVIGDAVRRHEDGMRRLLADPAREPAETVRALFELGAGGRARDCSRGCFIGRMGQELGEDEARLRRGISACLEEWRSLVATHLEAWRRRGYFREGFKAREAADGILALYEGGLLLARIAGEESPLEHARRTAVVIVASWRG